MLRWFCSAVIGTVVSGFAFLLVTGRYISDGPIIAYLSAGHGVHLGDVFVVAGWAVAMVMLVVLVGPYRRDVRRLADPGRARRLPADIGGGGRAVPWR